MLQPGDQIDIWVIEKALGSGGMGSVYRCHNRNATRILAAVKVLDAQLRKYPEAEARFVREAEILFQLDHPNIVKVRNVRTDVDPPYLEMEFVEGESLEERLRRGALPFDQAVEYLTQMCAAVAYLHKKGVRHRDIKPANLLATMNGKVKLVDFGLAMEADATRITQAGMTFGTVSYAPPEWISPDTLDPARWDLYSVGVVTYEMLTGRLAFPVSGQGSARQQAMQVIVGKQGHEPLDPGEEFHDDVRSLIRDLTQSDASKRIGSAAEAVRRSRNLVRTLRRQSGVTLAPIPEEMLLDGLDVTPDPPADRLDGGNTWFGTDRGAPRRDDAPDPPEGVVSAPISADDPAHSESSASLAPKATVGLGLLVTALVALSVLGALVSAGLMLWVGTPGNTRPVDIAVTGLPPDTPVGVRLGGFDPTEVDGMVFSFEDLSVGSHDLVWTLGDRCQVDACPGQECPSWCGSDGTAIEVKAGDGRQVITFDLKPPAERRVRVRTPELTEEWPLDFKLGSETGRRVEGGVVFDELEPGQYTLTAMVGSCEAANLGCWPDGECPAGCGSFRGKIIVPWGEGEHAWDLEIPDPETSGETRTTPAPKPKTTAPARPTAPASGGEAGSTVSVGQFATWLESNPDWQGEAAVAAGRAKSGYLKGWSGATPPSGTSKSSAVTSVSWYAAAAFCKARGGLATTDAQPHRWTESAASPYMELRIKGNQAAWRASDDRVSTALGPADVSDYMGFRCAN